MNAANRTRDLIADLVNDKRFGEDVLACLVTKSLVVVSDLDVDWSQPDNPQTEQSNMFTFGDEAVWERLIGSGRPWLNVAGYGTVGGGSCLIVAAGAVVDEEDVYADPAISVSNAPAHVLLRIA